MFVRREVYGGFPDPLRGVGRGPQFAGYTLVADSCCASGCAPLRWRGESGGHRTSRRKLRREVNFFLKSFPEHQRKE